MRALARWTWRIATALICYLILVSCAARPAPYDWHLEPTGIEAQLDHCARALTEDGETAQLCATSRELCRGGVAIAIRFGRMVPSRKLRIAKVSECKPLSAIHEQRTEVR